MKTKCITIYPKLSKVVECPECDGGHACSFIRHNCKTCFGGGKVRLCEICKHKNMVEQSDGTFKCSKCKTIEIRTFEGENHAV